MTKYLKIALDEQVKKLKEQFSNQKFDQMLDRDFETKSFRESFRPVFILTTIIAAAAQLLSCSTTAFALWYLTPYIHSLVNGLLILLVICSFEWAKHSIVTYVFRNFFQYGSLKTFTVVLLLIIGSASIGLSVYGSKKIVPLFLPDVVKQEAILMDEATVNNTYNAKIASVEADKKKYQEQREYKGKLRSEDIGVIALYAEDKRELEKQRKQELEVLADSNKALVSAAAATYQKQVEELEVKRESWKESFVTGVIIAELLFLLAMCGYWWYKAECETERKAISPKYQASTPNLSKTLQQLLSERESQPEPQVEALLAKFLQQSQATNPGARNEAKAQNINVNVNAKTKQPEERASMQIPQAGKTQNAKKKTTGTCTECGEDFNKTRSNHVFCSSSCRTSHWNKKQ